MKSLKSSHFWVKIGQFLIIASVLPITGAACGRAGLTNIRTDVQNQLAIRNCRGVPGAIHRNPDGSDGGFVASSAFVDASAYISPDSQVCDNSKVTLNAALYGSVKLSDSVNVSGQGVIVSGQVWAHGYVSIYKDDQTPGSIRAPQVNSENAQIEISGTTDQFTTVTGNSRVLGYIKIAGASISDNALVENDHTDSAILIDGGADIGGNAKVFFDVHGGPALR